MSVTTQQDFIRASLEGDATKATDLFNTLMLNKIEGSIETVRQDVASNLFGVAADGVSGSIES